MADCTFYVDGILGRLGYSLSRIAEKEKLDALPFLPFDDEENWSVFLSRLKICE